MKFGRFTNQARYTNGSHSRTPPKQISRCNISSTAYIRVGPSSTAKLGATKVHIGRLWADTHLAPRPRGDSWAIPKALPRGCFTLPLKAPPPREVQAMESSRLCRARTFLSEPAFLKCSARVAAILRTRGSYLSVCVQKSRSRPQSHQAKILGPVIFS